MKADLLTRLRQWSEKPNEGDPIIDAMAGDLQEALEFIEAERARVIGIIEVNMRASEADGTDGELWVLRHVLDAVNASPLPDASRLLPPPANDGGGAHEVAAVLRRRVDELEAEIERITPKFVAYEYLVSPAGEEIALEENARLRARIADLEAKR